MTDLENYLRLYLLLSYLEWVLLKMFLSPRPPRPPVP